MSISRRGFLGLALGGILLGRTQPAAAARFVDASGLGKGNFVWQPGVAPDGHVLIVVTGRQQIAHVYRGGHEIGIAPLKSVAAAGRRFAGVFSLADQRRERRAGEATRLVWTADAVEIGAAGQRFGRQPVALLTDEFADLLFKATGRGASIIVAEDRSGVTRVTTPGFPLLSGDAGRVAAAGLARRSARTVETADPMGREARLVVSLADRAAHLVRGGVIEASTAVEIAADAPSAGSSVYSLARGDEAGLEWLAVAIAAGLGEAHVADDTAAALLSSLTFANQAVGSALVDELAQGALVHVCTGTLRPEQMRRGVELLANRLPFAPEAVADPARTSQQRFARGQRQARTVEVQEATSSSKLVRQIFDALP